MTVCYIYGGVLEVVTLPGRKETIVHGFTENVYVMFHIRRKVNSVDEAIRILSREFPGIEFRKYRGRTP